MNLPILGHRWLIALGGVVLAALLSWAILFSPLLTVRSVRVLGAPAGDAVTIIAAADVPPGVTLIHVDIKGIEQRVAVVPRVATVTVRRDWPAALVIVVTERAAIGVVASGSRFQEIDSGGVVFGIPGPRPAGLVLVSATGAARQAVAAALAELPLAIYSRVDSALATTGDDVTFKLRSAQTIVWGSADNGPAKSTVLVALMARVKAHHYDVSAPELPTTS